MTNSSTYATQTVLKTIVKIVEGNKNSAEGTWSAWQDVDTIIEHISKKSANAEAYHALSDLDKYTIDRILDESITTDSSPVASEYDRR